MGRVRVLWLTVALLASTPAWAAHYDSDADRAALRQAATLSHSTVVDATSLPLVPDKVPAISAGLDDGERLAQGASGSARSLDTAARQRAVEMDAGVKASSELKIKELADPISAERLRWQRLTADYEDLKQKIDALPDGESKPLRPFLAKALAALQSAAETLRPLEESVKIMGAQALVMKEARDDARGSLEEIATHTAGVILRAEEIPAPLGDAKIRLGALGQEPRDVNRSRAWEKLEMLRGITRLLFEAADRACNRANDFRRNSNDYEKAAGSYETARRTASAGPAGVKSLLDAAQKALSSARG